MASVNNGWKLAEEYLRKGLEENRIKGDNLQMSIETISYGGSLKIKKKSERINIVGLIEGIRCQG